MIVRRFLQRTASTTSASPVFFATTKSNQKQFPAAAAVAVGSNPSFFINSNDSTASQTNYYNLVTRRLKSSSSSIHKRAAQALNKNNNSNKKLQNNTKTNESNTLKELKEETKGGAVGVSKKKDETEKQDIIFPNKKNDSDLKVLPNTTHVPDGSKFAAAVEASTNITSQPSTSGLRSSTPGVFQEFAPRISVVGVGGAGGNAVNNMIASSLTGVDFLAINTDAQHLSNTLTDNRLQIGVGITGGLGCGANPDAGRQAAEESQEEILEYIKDSHMVFITAGMGGGTGTGAAPVIADICYNAGILTVGVVTVPFRFEGSHRNRMAKEGAERLSQVVDTMIVIPNENLLRLADENTSFINAFALADDVLLAGIKSVTDLMTIPGLINLDFADVQSVMHGMGNAMLGSGQANGENRAMVAAEQALKNPLLGDMNISTAKGMLVNITGGNDMTLFEVDKAAQVITDVIEDPDANIIFGAAYDSTLDGSIRVSVVATGIDSSTNT